MEATPTRHPLPFRPGDFATLTEALDYAALGDTGANFYTGRGAIYASLPYAELRLQARQLARKLKIITEDAAPLSSRIKKKLKSAVTAASELK